MDVTENVVLWVLGTFVSLVAATVAGLIWGVRLEGKVDRHEKEIVQLRLDTSDDIRNMRQDMHYIRGRIDEVLKR